MEESIYRFLSWFGNAEKLTVIVHGDRLIASVIAPDFQERRRLQHCAKLAYTASGCRLRLILCYSLNGKIYAATRLSEYDLKILNEARQ